MSTTTEEEDNALLASFVLLMSHYENVRRAFTENHVQCTELEFCLDRMGNSLRHHRHNVYESIGVGENVGRQSKGWGYSYKNSPAQR